MKTRRKFRNNGEGVGSKEAPTDYGSPYCATWFTLGWCVNRLIQVADRRLLAWHYATTGEAT